MGEEEINVLKIIKYLYTKKSLLGLHGAWLHLVILVTSRKKIQYFTEILLVTGKCCSCILLSLSTNSVRGWYFTVPEWLDKPCVGSCCLPVYSSYIYFLMERWNVNLLSLWRLKHFLDMFILEWIYTEGYETIRIAFLFALFKLPPHKLNYAFWGED